MRRWVVKNWKIVPFLVIAALLTVSGLQHEVLVNDTTDTEQATTKEVAPVQTDSHEVKKQTSTPIDKLLEKSKHLVNSFPWDYWSTTLPGKQIDQRLGAGSANWVLWATVVILALVLYKTLFRRKKANTVSWSLLGKSQPASQSSSGSVTVTLIVIGIVLGAAAVAMDGFGISDTNFITTWRYGCTTQSKLNAAPPIDQAGRVITLCNGVDENLFLRPIAGYSLEYQYSDQTKGDAADLLYKRQTQDFFSLNPPQNRGGVWLLIQNKSDTSGWKTSGLQTLKLAVRAGTRPTH